jgi:hypothetical protein
MKREDFVIVVGEALDSIPREFCSRSNTELTRQLRATNREARDTVYNPAGVRDFSVLAEGQG